MRAQMPTRYGRSPWVDQFPKSRTPTFPAHRGPIKVDAAIVGGGLTGCVTAYAFAAAGIKVALFEADAIGCGASGASTGCITEDPGCSFVEVEKLVGLRNARHAWEAWRRAALDFAAVIRRLGLKCNLEPRSSLLVATTAEQATRLGREQKARKAAGLDAVVARGRAIAADAGLTGSLGLHGHHDATIDPYRATLGFATAASERGALIFERSPVRKVGFNRKDAEVFTPGGSFRTRRVVVATAMPTAVLFHSLARHFWFKSTYFALTERIPARIRRNLGTRTVVIRDVAVPPHVIRWVDDERLLIQGADGPRVGDRQRDKTIVQRTGQLMYELSTLYPDISGIQPAYGWEAPYALTGEGLPYFGQHRNFPHQLLAFGDASHGVTGAYLASRVLLRHYLDNAEPAADAFAFTR
jgi:glycine/D-amino acid oxidase-like deaminating enzyme